MSSVKVHANFNWEHVSTQYVCQVTSYFNWAKFLLWFLSYLEVGGIDISVLKILFSQKSQLPEWPISYSLMLPLHNSHNVFNRSVITEKVNKESNKSVTNHCYCNSANNKYLIIIHCTLYIMPYYLNLSWAGNAELFGVKSMIFQ